MTLAKFSQVLAHFEKTDPKIAKVLVTVDLNEWFENRDKEDHFQYLARNIIYQQLAGRAASTIYSRFVALVNEVKPEKVLARSDQELRDVGLSWAKVKYVKDLALQVQNKTVILNNLSTLDDESVIKELVKVKGIGRWTAEMFLLFTLHRENIFSHLDLGLKNGFAKLYGVREPSHERIEKVVQKWAPYKSYGSISLWHYLNNR